MDRPVNHPPGSNPTLAAMAWRPLLRRPRGYFANRIAPLYPQIDFHHLKPLDPLRFIVQTIWLLLIIPPAYRRPAMLPRLAKGWKRLSHWVTAHLPGMNSLRQSIHPEALKAKATTLAHSPVWQFPAVRILSYSIAFILVILAITTPLDLTTQTLFMLMLWIMALSIRRISGNLASILLILLSAIASTRYLWWRATHTLNWDDLIDLSLGLGLLAAEIYAWLVLVLGFIQTIWPLRRQPAPLPEDTAQWPSVDVFIPTYNEPLKVVKPTVLAATAMDWPDDKINVYLLDDGRRPEFRQFAEEAGVHYIIRPDNRHAKAGNLNHALAQTSGDLIAIFDCDHVPTRSFLQTNAGWFLQDEKLALMQTPHHFYSPDPFERNLQNFRKVPNENELFYGVVQDGNDFWNAAFFCGSCALLRRGPLEEIGGIAMETVTEDAHTALRLHRHGYNSAYLNIPQAAGLATESLSAHVGQRIRWARGMIQVLRLDNPLRGKGLSFGQRLCYTNAMFHFLAGVPRLVFLTAPLAFLIGHAYIIHAPALMILMYVLPHLVHANLANSRLQGRYRHSFWAEVYEAALAWYIARPTTVALFAPHKGSFNVTAKGGLIEQRHFDWEIAKPHLVLAGMNIIGILFGIWRLAFGPDNEISTVMLNIAWTLYNLIILGATLSVAAETRQIRFSHRIPVRMPALIQLPNGHTLEAETIDFSEGGVAIELKENIKNLLHQSISVSLSRASSSTAWPGRIIRAHGNQIGIHFDPMTREQEKQLVQCLYGRADAWIDWSKDRPVDHPLHSMMEILQAGLSGFHRVLYFLSPRAIEHLYKGHRALIWSYSLFPRTPEHLQTQGISS